MLVPAVLERGGRGAKVPDAASTHPPTMSKRPGIAARSQLSSRHPDNGARSQKRRLQDETGTDVTQGGCRVCGTRDSAPYDDV
jgi:hypothetical protein